MRCLALLLLALAGCEPDVDVRPRVEIAVAGFDPRATPPVLPAPNDLALMGADGFPSSVPAIARFSAPLDPSSATPRSVIVVDLITMQPRVDLRIAVDGATLTITAPAGWERGHRYAVLLVGGTDAAGLRGAAGERVVASPAFALLRSPLPLLARCGDLGDPACACPSPDDPTCHSTAQGLDDATARASEPLRAQTDAALTALLDGRARGDLVLFWTFTITTRPTTVRAPAPPSVSPHA
jgi:hypothetical protein